MSMSTRVGLSYPASVSYAAALVSLAITAACGRNEPTLYDGPGPPERSVEAPIDRLAPGELEPSDELAFGLPLPQGMRVVRRFDDATHAKGKIDHDELVAYLKRRLATSHVTYELDKVVFDKVKLRNAPNEADRTLRIEVWVDRGMTWLRVTDTTVPPAVEGLSEAERWRRAGMHPDGSPLDPEALK